MSAATNVDATAVNTIRWLSAPETTIVVPVYQRQYRWDIGGCEKLLADIRAVAAAEHTQTHFIGSILSTANTVTDAGQLVLIDGQQRITTLMLLIAALQHTVEGTDPTLAQELGQVLVSAADPTRTKLLPHREWAEVYESVVLGRRPATAELRESRFDDNYAFFRSQVPAGDVRHIWNGLQRLEHVSITLGVNANAQQTFESLNSTGEPLKDHELIHNYLLMGLTHEEQSEIEDSFWLPIEENTGESIGAFWRHYLLMTTGREIDSGDGRGVYDTFRRQFPRLTIGILRQHATQWRDYSEVYRTLLDPATAPDLEISQQLQWVSAFGQGMYPLVMRAYFDHLNGTLKKPALVTTLERIQSLLLRRTVSGLSNSRLVARLCRARARSPEALLAAIARVTPSDERVRIALKYSDLPHAAYVLARISGIDSGAELDVEHIFPLSPGDTWSGDGQRVWADYSEDEQNSHRALTQTLGNLALLEHPLAERTPSADYPHKRSTVYAQSDITTTRTLAETDTWGTAAIAERTAALTAEFLRIWERPATVSIDDDGLTPVLDAQRRRGWPHGWNREFEYVEYRGEHWEVHDVKNLFNRIFSRLWADSHDEVVTFSDRRGGPLYEAKAWNGHWDKLDDTHYLYMGWDSHYMLTAVQGLLEETGLASEVFVKYSYIGQAM